MPSLRNHAHGPYVGEINMLPMIDILLVLLFIFMLHPPEQQQKVQLPPPGPPQGVPERIQIVLDVTRGGMLLNGQPVPSATLEATLAAAFRHRALKLLFVHADPEVPYRDVISAVDRARGAGVRLIAYQP